MELFNEGMGWLWLTALAGIICLGAAIAYGIGMWRTAPKDPVTRAVREEVTHEHYESPEGQKP
jgi:hypothetical protein